MLSVFDRRLAWMLLVPLMAGCASRTMTPPASTAESWQQRQERLADWDHWQVRGKVAVRTPNRRDSASLDWVQRGGHFRLFMAGPFGRGAVTLEGTPEALTLSRAGKPPQRTTDPQAFVRRQLGWSLPLKEAAWWARGLPAPRDDYRMKLDNRQRLQQLRQAGWQIHYQGYQQTSWGDLPRALKLEGPRDLRVRLVFNDWRALEENSETSAMKAH